MNIIKKISILSVICLIYITNVCAQEALCIGGPLGGTQDTTNDVVNSCKALSSLGYHTIVDVTDEKKAGVLANLINKYNIRTNTHGVFYFAGHGGKNHINWHMGYGFYQDGTTPHQGGQIKISALNLKNTKIGIFMACETAKTTDNITKYAQRQGVTVTTGWVYEIYKTDVPKWSNAFFTKLKAGKTFRASYQYANSLNYKYNEKMKTHRVYGDATITGEATVLTPLVALALENSFPLENRKNVSFKIKDSDNVEEIIINKIKSEFDSQFDIKNYDKEISEGPDGVIYDFNLMIEDAKTTHGYSAQVEDKTVTIYDNIEDFKETAKSLIDTQTNSCKLNNQNNYVEKHKEELITKYKKKFKEYDITIDSTRKFYDDEENRIVLDINIKIKDPNTGAYSIFTESI